MSKSKTLELIYVDSDIKRFIDIICKQCSIPRSAYVRAILRKEIEKAIAEGKYKVGDSGDKI